MPELAFASCVYFRHLTFQRIARLTGRFGYMLFKYLYQKYSREDPRFADYYFQLAAETATKGKGDLLLGKFAVFQGNRVLFSHPILSVLLHLPHKVSIIWGKFDPLLPYRFAPVIRQIRPHTDAFLIENAGHNPTHSNPKAFYQAIKMIFENSDKGASRSTTDLLAATSPSPSADSLDSLPSSSPLSLRSGLVHRRASGILLFPKSSEEKDVTEGIDEIILGNGIGFCNGCRHEVHIFKSYWRCGCGAWSFVGLISLEETKNNIDSMIKFLEELYVKGTFDAKKSKYITDFLKVRSPYRSKDSLFREQSSELIRKPGFPLGKLIELK